MRHPTQPIARGRFKGNAIVRYLLDAGPFDLDHLAMLPFSNADRQQFAQLIGYSLDGYGELSYVTDAAYARGVREGGRK